jgi:hypothetical protein
MPRPRKVFRPVRKNTTIPEDLALKVDLLLWSDAEERVPHGAFQELIVELLEGWVRDKADRQRVPQQGEDLVADH